MANTAAPRAAAHAVTMAQPGRTLDPIQRQAAIENALSMALYFVRQDGDLKSNLWAATARANRALTLLKLASEDARMGRA